MVERHDNCGLARRRAHALVDMTIAAIARATLRLGVGVGIIVVGSQVAHAEERAALPPLAGEWLEPLAGEKLGFVSPPTGARERRPIVVGVHGAGDRPDWACSEWRAIFGPTPFIVCPRGGGLGGAGAGRPASYAWSSREHVERAIEAALAEVKRRYPDHLALDAPRVYAGFSQGARIGAEVVARAPDVYPFAIFLEGLGDVRSPSFTRPFHDRGGRRLLLACSQRGCAASRQLAARALTEAKVSSRVVDAGPVGHVVNAPVIEALRREVPWLLEGDPSWAPTIAAIAPR